MEENTKDEWTLFQVDSLAKTSALQTKVQKQTERKESKGKGLDYGSITPVLWGKLDLESSSLKTAQCSLIEDSRQSYATFTSSGMMRNGVCFMLPNSDFHTSESDYMEWPTPASSDGKIVLKLVESYKKYYRNEHQDKALYQFHLNGLTANQARQMY